jgi:acetoin utilization protein AcuB
MSQVRTVGEFMTRSPHTIGRGASLQAAREMMADFGIRHLPVLEGGALVGLVSDRDLAGLGGLARVQVEGLRVDEAMTADPHGVAPGAALAEVAAQMAGHRYGATVVMEHGRVVGVFTTVDALRALGELAR